MNLGGAQGKGRFMLLAQHAVCRRYFASAPTGSPSFPLKFGIQMYPIWVYVHEKFHWNRNAGNICIGRYALGGQPVLQH